MLADVSLQPFDVIQAENVTKQGLTASRTLQVFVGIWHRRHILQLYFCLARLTAARCGDGRTQQQHSPRAKSSSRGMSYAGSDITARSANYILRGSSYICPLGGNTVTGQVLREQCASVSVWGHWDGRMNNKGNRSFVCHLKKRWLYAFHCIINKAYCHFWRAQITFHNFYAGFCTLYINVYYYDPLQRGSCDPITTWRTVGVGGVLKWAVTHSFRLSSAMRAANPMICTVALLSLRPCVRNKRQPNSSLGLIIKGRGA